MEDASQVESFLQEPVPQGEHELQKSLVFAKNLIDSLKQDNEELHNRLELVEEMDEMGGPLQGATSMAVSFGGKVFPAQTKETSNTTGPKDELFGDFGDAQHSQNALQQTLFQQHQATASQARSGADPEAQRILSKKKSKHDRFFSTYNLLSREVNNADQMIQQLGTFESIVRYHKSAQTYNSIIDNLSMQFKQNKDSLADAYDQLKQYKIELSEETLDASNLENYQHIIESTIDSVLSEGSKWLDSIDQIKDEFSGARALVHPDHQKVASYEIKLRELQASLPVEATAKLAALGVLPEFVKKALDDEDIEEEEKKKKNKQKRKKRGGGKKKVKHEQKRTLLINDDFDAQAWENEDDEFEDQDDEVEDDGDNDGYGDSDGGYEADDQDEFEDPSIVAYKDLLRTANIIKNTILQKIDTAKTFIETDAIKNEDLSSPVKSGPSQPSAPTAAAAALAAEAPAASSNMKIPNADGDEDDYEYDKTPDVYDPMSKFDDAPDALNMDAAAAAASRGPLGQVGSGYTMLVDSIEEELKQFADILVRAGEYVHPSQRALIFACKEIVKQRTENNRLKKRIDQVEGELAEARNTLNAKQNELNNIHTQAQSNGGVLKVYEAAGDIASQDKDAPLDSAQIAELEISWLPEMAEAMRTINKQCNDLDGLLVVSEDYKENDDYVMKTVRKNIDTSAVLQTISSMKTSVREFCRHIMKTYHLVPPHVNYIRQLEEEFQFTKGYCRKVYKELDDKTDAIYHRDNVIKEKDLMIEALEDRLARIMTSASASAETRMEALMGMNKQIQSYNKIMDVVSEEMKKRSGELGGFEEKCRSKLDSSSYRKIKKFVKELVEKNDKSSDIMRSEMENARLYVHSDRVMVDKLQSQVMKLKNELAALHEKIETGHIYDEEDEEDVHPQSQQYNAQTQGNGNAVASNLEQEQNGREQDYGYANGMADEEDDYEDEDDEDRSESRRRRRKKNKDKERKGIQFGPNVSAGDGNQSGAKGSKNSRHRSGKSVHDIAFRQHMIQIDEEIEALKKNSEASEDVARLNKEMMQLQDKNGKLSSEIEHLKRTLGQYEKNAGNDDLYANTTTANGMEEDGMDMDQDSDGTINKQSEMQAEIYRLRQNNEELRAMIQEMNNEHETPGGPGAAAANNNSNNNMNESNSLLYDGNDEFGMGNDGYGNTPGGDAMHDDDAVIGGDVMTTGGQLYQTPIGPQDPTGALLDLTKQVEQQRQYILELSVKIKRLETDHVKDKQKLLEATCQEIDHLRGIIKKFTARQQR